MSRVRVLLIFRESVAESPDEIHKEAPFDGIEVAGVYGENTSDNFIDAVIENLSEIHPGSKFLLTSV